MFLKKVMKDEVEYEYLGYDENYFNKHPIERLILRKVKNFPLLDVGCGDGNLLKLFKDKDVEGFDISKIAINLAKKRGLKVKVSTINDFSPRRKFKTILLIGVLPLLRNPAKDLNKISEWLDKDGVIILTVPNSTSPRTKRDKHQIYFPSYFEFRKLLRDNGFEIADSIGGGRAKIPLISSVILYIIRKK